MECSSKEITIRRTIQIKWNGKVIEDNLPKLFLIWGRKPKQANYNKKK